jgi:transketolase
MSAMDMNPEQLARVAAQLRYRIIATSSRAEVPHLGSCLSCADILVTLYSEVLRHNPSQPGEPGRDRFILSKGHAAPALFQMLAMAGFYPESHLDGYGEDGSLFGEHPPAHGIPGIEAATGSLGHGLPIALGTALALRMKGNNESRVYALLSDGECNEGSVWEAAMMAPAHALKNLTVIIDFNKWQATGRSEETLALQPLRAKWEAFGWSTLEIEGHDFTQLVTALSTPPDVNGRPLAIIAHTVKGKGVSFMEDDNNWHYRIPTAAEVAAAAIELGVQP